MRSRSVTARASRIACAVASEPLIVAIIDSADGITSTTFSASATSTSVTPRPVRSTPPIAPRSASLTTGALCPNRIAPNAAW